MQPTKPFYNSGSSLLTIQSYFLQIKFEQEFSYVADFESEKPCTAGFHF